MRWPWARREKRDSGGDFSDAVVRLIEAQAAGTAADASSTAAVEAASGALSRAFASAEVVGEPWVAEAVSPGVLAQDGARPDPVSGDSMHVIRMGRDGMVTLIPASSSWHWEGTHDPSTWTVRATCYGPFDKHDMELASVRRRLLPVGLNAGPTVHRDRAAELGTHHGAVAIGSGAISCR